MILRALSDLWTAAALPVANHLWQSTLFVALAGILAFAFRKNQARIRYWIWLTASVKFLLPFVLLVTLGSHLARPRVSTPAQIVAYTAVEEWSQPFAVHEMPVIYQASPSPARKSPVHWLPSVVLAVWLAGIAVVVAMWLRSWIRVSLLMRKAAPLEEGPEIEALRRLESSLGVRKPIKVVLSRNWMEPGVFGIFRTVLLWPEGISEHLDERHIEAILAHEVCHARRYDNLTALLHMLVEAIFWFHPLVWWLGARLEEERERACDEEVSLLCRQPHIYAEGILRVCKYCSESPLACVSGITGADLKRRIVQIMTERVVCKLTWKKKMLIGAVGVCVTGAPVLLGQAKAAERMSALIFSPTSSLPHRLLQAEQSAAGKTSQAPESLDSAANSPAGKPLLFEVVAIHPTKPGNQNSVQFGFASDGLHVSGITLDMLLGYVNRFQFMADRVSGGPDWTRTEAFDIQAKVADSDAEEYAKLANDMTPAGDARRRAMLKALLVEQFKLKMHTEKREGPIYALVVAKGGLKIKPSSSEDPPVMAMARRGHLSVQRATIGAMAPIFAQELGRPVADETGLTGKYDFSLDWTPDGARAEDTSQASAPSIFTAVQEQLGLKLEAQKGPVDYVVIDSAEKPNMDVVQDSISKPDRPQVNPMSSQPLEFEAATIKPVDTHSSIMVGTDVEPDGTVKLDGLSLKGMMEVAFNASYWQIAGGEPWMEKNEYNVVAEPPDTVRQSLPDTRHTLFSIHDPRLREMLQTLLIQRFQLKIRRTTQTGKVYFLERANKKMALLPAKVAPADLSSPQYPSGDIGFTGLSRDSTLAEWTLYDTTMPELANYASSYVLHRPVFDHSGLSGAFDFRSAPEDWKAHWEDQEGSFLGLLKQIGLKLAPGTGPVEMLTIDHAELPSPN